MCNLYQGQRRRDEDRSTEPTYPRGRGEDPVKSRNNPASATITRREPGHEQVEVHLGYLPLGLERDLAGKVARGLRPKG